MKAQFQGPAKHFFAEDPKDPLAPCVRCGEHPEAHPLPSKRLRVALLLSQETEEAE